MVVGTTLTLILLATDPGDLDAAAEAELDRCAARIEALKARRATGWELDRLLRRAQELEAELERTAAQLPPSQGAPSPEELRERADAARDEADRLAQRIDAIDVQLEDGRRGRAVPGAAIARAALTTAGDDGDERERALVAERAALAARRAEAEAEAVRLDAEARAAERIR